MKVGTNAGESLIFGERGVGSSSWSNFNTTMQMGDGTSHLGYYIAQLALEYYLLQLNHQKTDSTLYELACALYAINRLDIKAETTLGSSNCTGSLNGFFVRDDVPCNFIKNNYEHFNYFSAGYNNNSQSRGFASYFQGGMQTLNSDWCNAYEINGNQYPFGLPANKQPYFYISQDQVYNLLYGLAFVRKFIPKWLVAKDRQGNTFWFQDGQIYISEEAKAIAKRIIDNIRNPKKCNGSGCTGDDWDIKYPHNCENPKSKGGVKWFAFPLAEAECVIDHEKWGDGFSKNICSCSKCSNAFFSCSAQYHDNSSLTGGKVLWDLFITTGVIGGIFSTGDVNNHVMKGNLLAVCNCYYQGCYINRSDEIIATVADVGNYYWYMYHQPLARYLLHGGKLYFSPFAPGGSNYANPVFLLNEMNACNHFNLGGDNNYSSLGWSSDTRLDHPERIGRNYDWTGEYPSVDYMLYFNLWTTKTVYDHPGGVYPDYVNLSHYYINALSNINTPFYVPPGYYNPPSVPITATSYYKTQIDAYETIYMEKTRLPFYTNENYMRAGKEIILKATSTPGDNSESIIKPGLTTVNVSDGVATYTADAGIRFYIKKYDCATDNGNYNPNVDASYPYRLAQDSQPTNFRNIELVDELINDTMKIKHQPHYVNSEVYFVNIHQPNYGSENLNVNESDNSYLNNSIYIIPNPAETKILINIPEGVEYDEIKITNILGQVMDNLKKQEETSIEMDVHQYERGMYFIVIMKGEQIILSEKFIKQ